VFYVAFLAWRYTQLEVYETLPCVFYPDPLAEYRSRSLLQHLQPRMSGEETLTMSDLGEFFRVSKSEQISWNPPPRKRLRPPPRLEFVQVLYQTVGLKDNSRKIQYTRSLNLISEELSKIGVPFTVTGHFIQESQFYAMELWSYLAKSMLTFVISAVLLLLVLQTLVDRAPIKFMLCGLCLSGPASFLLIVTILKVLQCPLNGFSWFIILYLMALSLSKFADYAGAEDSLAIFQVHLTSLLLFILVFALSCSGLLAVKSPFFQTLLFRLPTIFFCVNFVMVDVLLVLVLGTPVKCEEANSPPVYEDSYLPAPLMLPTTRNKQGILTQVSKKPSLSTINESGSYSSTCKSIFPSI
ncbi:hypothetical protein Ciccas_013273, partial [Cichlidogyrus casuarinus]